MVGKYKVITLCGSTRFKDEFMEAQKRLTLDGNIVISVGLFGHSGDNEVWTEGTKEMLDDMQFIYRSLMQQYTEDHLIVYGRSLGSGLAAKVASDNHPRYLILDSPYYNFKKVIERFLPILPIRFVLRYHLRTDRWIAKVTCPIYILHGTKDRLIPISHSEDLQKINPKRITLIRIHGGRHNNLPEFDEYHNFIRDILKH